MAPIKKAYGYITRIVDNKYQVLVFRHCNPEAGIQIPKGTVQSSEDPYEAVIREMEEETGLKDINVEGLIADDFWETDDGQIHHRYFYQINVSNTLDEWDFDPTGGGEEDGLTFHFFWISSPDDVPLVRGHGDYLYKIFS